MYGEFLPVKPGSGFQMDGYYVWCGSSILGEDGKVYLFAARWPKEKTFPWGYMTDSEIVMAVADAPDEPFRYVKTVIAKRPGGFWDSMMAHNPYIMKIREQYVLFYIGTPDGRVETRKIGFAWADSLEGPWHRSDEPLELPPNANNPAVIEKPEGGFLLYFRDGDLKVYAAEAERYEGPYRIRNANVCPKGIVEDMFVFYRYGRYEMLAEDAGGAYTGLVKGGVHFASADGITWDCDDETPAYDFRIEYTDGTVRELQRRERPFLFRWKDRLFMFTGAKINGPDMTSGGDTWNLVQELREKSL